VDCVAAQQNTYRTLNILLINLISAKVRSILAGEEELCFEISIVHSLDVNVAFKFDLLI
jgi:hypothetical protein